MDRFIAHGCQDLEEAKGLYTVFSGQKHALAVLPTQAKIGWKKNFVFLESTNMGQSACWPTYSFIDLKNK